MQIDFSLLDNITIIQPPGTDTDAPGSPGERFNKIEEQTDTQERETPRKATETHQEKTRKESLEEIIARLSKKYNINQATGAPTEPQRSPESLLNCENDKKDAQELKSENKATETPTEYSKKAFVKLEREQKAIERAKIVYKEYQDNIKVSESLRAEIAHEIQAGKAPQETLKKAIECISLMTGDRAFYITLVRYLDEIQ